jgi:hypothetical protein
VTREVPIAVYHGDPLRKTVRKHIRENPTLDLQLRKMSRGRIAIVGTPRFVLPIKV